MIRFILADLRRFSGGALAVVILIALSVALSVAVTLQERAVRLGSARAAEKFDLLVGAPGSETQLALSSVFLQPAPLPLLSGQVLARLADDPRVAMAAPVGFGDSSFGHPIVGTTTALVAALSPTLAEGAVFTRLGEAVVGADVPLSTGAEVKPMHGSVETGGETHTEIVYHVTGRMAPTGTAWDRAILVPIRAVWSLHGMAGAHEEDHEHADADAGADDHEHEHEHGHVDAQARLDEHFDAGTPGVPAILVKPKTIADAYRLRQEYRSETTLAVFPAEVLTRLYGTLGDARSLLLAIAIGTQGIVIAAILLVAIMHIGSRRRQIGALRALGAPMRSVVVIVWGELFLLFLAGIALGGGLGLAVAELVSARMTAATAVRLPVEFAREDWRLAAGFVIAAAIVSLVPAIAALRLSPAAALRS
ncbi:FtsX-like permease family protein [Allorhizobium borbori]|uniref:Putative ABC transport system permease protein n=1 Tax=Allorhizobium borbori TaxID=485907 RepID=A0A7W6K155_9HYPH|nr:ABC transporter permease [Allorhizobium borbori]MBB4103258.1 putative ABC transport system permease protein [Allorhizobium borbori]